MIEPICREEMRALTAEYAKATGLTISAISRKHYGKSGFLTSFLSGEKTMFFKVYDRIMGDIRAELAALASAAVPKNARKPVEK